MNTGNDKLSSNVDEKVVEDFGREWKHFNHSNIDTSILDSSFDDYFNIFPLKNLEHAEGFDMGCGSGRWAKYIVPNVRFLHCIDPSKSALDQAEINLQNFQNCDFECSSVDSCSLKDSSQDFAYSLGVLHHIPNTREALKSLPYPLKFATSQLIACSIYYPLARLAKLLEIFKINVSNFPLSEYRSKSFYIMRTDSLDRFGTRLEQRFTKKEIEEMLKDSGFEKISFSKKAPFWVSLAYKK